MADWSFHQVVTPSQESTCSVEYFFFSSCCQLVPKDFTVPERLDQDEGEGGRGKPSQCARANRRARRGTRRERVRERDARARTGDVGVRRMQTGAEGVREQGASRRRCGGDGGFDDGRGERGQRGAAARNRDDVCGDD